MTDVLVTGIEMRWISVRPRPIAIGAKLPDAAVAVDSRMMMRKKAVRTNSIRKADPEAVAARRVHPIAVGREATGSEVGLAGRDRIEDDSAEDAAKHLRQPVGAELVPREAAGHRKAQRNGRVEMTTGDAADGVGHRENRQAKRQRDAGKADAELREACGKNGASAPSENEPEGAESFGGELPEHECHPVFDLPSGSVGRWFRRQADA
ncbi:hypothetical protein GGR05_000336 [Aureimonas phyllosphaerae]|uniref:Uncharacterized protein n=1 Tax=Aureimonas phyllosphaerae TaxID=1166078 RepID=A0A7W6BT49_9HYPH|nr:hypothetical protein [Aureimonas phyllosphaerae]MBB3958559.1 hypothetical protein [Aureimonas phyllosphaerae]